ncbi:trypco2 family protein [Salininema proteolyticum]|uniref:Trypco2 family protein n=1 Tax=Salininema proteolyticum TaxID=1607685 RepID=A0ABV8TWE1_9ACTN
MANPSIPLKDAISALRNDLVESLDDADDSLGLRVKEIHLDLAVETTSSAGGKAGVSLWKVVDASASADRAKASTHRLSLTIEPLTRDEDGEGPLDLAGEV